MMLSGQYPVYIQCPPRYALAVIFCLAIALPVMTGPVVAEEVADQSAPESQSFLRFLDRQYLLDNGHDLPNKYGISPFVVKSSSDLKVDSLKFAFSEDDPLTSNPLVTMDELSNEILTGGLIMDAWVLPFLNLYATVSYIDGEMDTAVNIPGNSQPIPIDFTGTSYGLGGSLVMGYKKFFVLLDYNYMEMDTTAYEEKIPMSNFTTRVGWNFDYAWLPDIAWVSYIDTEFKGTFDLVQKVGEDVDPETVPPGATSVILQFEVAPYHTYAVGGQWELNDKFQIISELGFDKVNSLMVALNYRWN